MKRYSQEIQEQIAKDYNNGMPYIVGHYSQKEEKYHITATFADKRQAEEFAEYEGEEVLKNYDNE